MNVTSSRCQYLPSYSAAVQDSPTGTCRRHSLADCVAGLEVMAPPILFYLTRCQTYSCLLVVGLPTGSYHCQKLHLAQPSCLGAGSVGDEVRDDAEAGVVAPTFLGHSHH